MDFKVKDRIYFYNRRRYINSIKKRLYQLLPILILLVFFINNQVVFQVIIKDSSMVPHFKPGSQIYFNRLSLGFRWPFKRGHPNNLNQNLKLKIGDVIAFENPYTKPKSLLRQLFDVPVSIITLGLINLDPRQISIKRVIGLPGNSLKIIDKQLYINQQRLDPGGRWIIHYEDQRVFPSSVSTRDNLEEVFVPNGYVYVLSDNWDIFNDSRTHGLVPFHKIEGIAIGQR